MPLRYTQTNTVNENYLIYNRMRIYKTLIFISLSLFVLLFQSCSLPADDEAAENPEGEDTITSELPWEGETDKFTINAKEGIRLNDPQEDAGTAYATFPSSSVKNTRWEFGVRLTFNPSANNYARFYLTSSSSVLSGSLNGYYIQIGGVKDNVTLYRQNGEQSKLLASGRELMKGNNSPKLYIKVECDNNGYWTFWTRLDSEDEYTKEKQIKDNSIQNSSCCGIYCIYTQTRSKGITFHHVHLSNDVETTTKPDGTPDEPDTPADPDPVPPDYPAEVKGILLFNEVMYDNATDGAEYIELYNPSGSTVSVPSLKLMRYIDAGANTTTTKSTVILQQTDGNQEISVPPYGYICLTKSAATLIKKHKTNGETIIGITNFPKLTNEDSYLAIMTNEEKSRLIDKCSYFESMHSSGDKRHQGISLEKVSPELSSSTRKNWHSSKALTGGTPGIPNSQE